MAAKLDATRRLKEIITDTIVLLCKSGLQYDEEFTIEALVGITVDRKNVILVSIQETVGTAFVQSHVVGTDRTGAAELRHGLSTGTSAEPRVPRRSEEISTNTGCQRKEQQAGVPDANVEIQVSTKR